MSESSRQTESDARWSRLKQAIFAPERRRNMLSRIPLLELPLFLKETRDSKSTYLGFHPDLVAQKEKETEQKMPPFQHVTVERPPLQESCFKAEELNAEDQTGLLRMYPSEEVLAAYLLLNKEMYKGKRIVELGAGFCGLAGLLFVKNLQAEFQGEMALTDGNELCVQLIQDHIEMNQCQALNVKSKLLLWDRHADYQGVETYDLVIISDGLYLNRIHPDLLNAIYHYMAAPDGQCIIISPPRFKSAEFFIQQAHSRFLVDYGQGHELEFLETVRDKSTQNFHPRFIRLRHRACTSQSPTPVPLQPSQSQHL